MGQYVIRRILAAIPTLLFISFVIFALLDLAPGDPTSNLPQSIPQEVKERIRTALGINDPFPVRYGKWAYQFMVIEPINAFENVTGARLGGAESRLRLTSWTSRGKPVVDIIVERLPQTLWVVGSAYLLSVLIAVPLGIYAAVRQNSVFDHLASLVVVIGFSLPTFFTGLLLIQVFADGRAGFRHFTTPLCASTAPARWGSRYGRWCCPSQSWPFSKWPQPAALPAPWCWKTCAWIMCARRAQGVERTGRRGAPCRAQQPDPGRDAGGAGHPRHLWRRHRHRADLCRQRDRKLLITSIQSNDIPVTQTCLMIYAVLVVLFNLVADIAYGLLDRWIRYGSGVAR